MKTNGWNGDPIDVVRMSEGKLTIMDNTRVVSAREARIEVQANIHDANELLQESLYGRGTLSLISIQDEGIIFLLLLNLKK